MPPFIPTSSRAWRLAVSNYYSRRLLATTTPAHHEECDVVIVGGGPAGLALASALGSSDIVRENLRVTLVEAGDLFKVRDWTASPGAFSNRVSSLTNASQNFLKEIGAWNHVEMERTSPVEEMQVWDGISDARITFSASDLGLDAPEQGMARMTENLNLQRALLHHLDQFPDIQLLQKTKVKTIVRDSDERGNWPMVVLDNDRVLRTRLLVGADGFNSPVRSYAQIPSFGWAYDTQAIVATLSHPPRGRFQNPNTTSYQRFLPTGPIAFLPISATVSSLVWSTKPQLASALLAADPQVLTSMINAAFRLPERSLRYLHDLILKAHAAGTPIAPADLHAEILFRERAHAIDHHSAYASASAHTENAGVPPADADAVPPLVMALQPGTAASFPLRFNHAEAYIGDGAGARTVLVGDAAHTVHPLAGQGLNMGLADVECLAKCIRGAVLHGGDVGSHTALLPYAQERYFENHTLMGAIDKLHKVYSSTLEPVVWARSVGVEVLNELDAVKAAIMMTAGGQASGANRNGRTDAGGWMMAAKGVEGLAGVAGAAKMIGEGIKGVVGTGLRGLLQATAQDKKT